MTMVGHPVAQFWGYKTDGLFQTDAEAAAYVNKDGQRLQESAKAGDIKYVDLNGDGKPEYGMSFEAVQDQPSIYTFLFGLFGVSWDTKSYMHSQEGTNQLQFAPAM